MPAGWCKPSVGAKYGGIKDERVFKRWLKNGLRHVRLENGRILIKYQWIDQYLELFEVKNEAKQIAEELVEDMRA
jgi:hypothetical protein